MRTNELRMGNFVDLINRSTKFHTPQNEVFKIGFIDFFKIHLYPFDKPFALEHKPKQVNVTDVTGIPLTEEWLKRFGFTLVGKNSIVNCDLPYYAKDALLLFFNGSPPSNTYLVGYGFNVDDQYYAATRRWINSVHELQNVYKEYTTSELILK